jgi:hypothetical protein
MYKIMKVTFFGNEKINIIRSNDNVNFTSFPADPANTNYAQFKKDIQEGAELLDDDGQIMTLEQAKAFVATLP